MSEMTFWDYITVVVALAIIVIYIALRVRRTLSSRGCSCGLKPSGCSIESAERCSGSTTTTVPVKNIGINKRDERD